MRVPSPYIGRFTDFLQPFGLYRGKGSSHSAEDQVGCVKGAIRLYEASQFREGESELNKIPSNDPVDV